MSLCRPARCGCSFDSDTLDISNPSAGIVQIEMPASLAGANPIRVFLDATERDAEIPAPTEGVYCHLRSTDDLMRHNGTSWEYAISGMKTWTPIWNAAVSTPSIAGGSLVGRYQVVGKKMHFHIILNFGSTTNGGAGFYSFSMPAGFTYPAFEQYVLCKGYTVDGRNWAGWGIMPGTGAAIINPYLPLVTGNTVMEPVMNANASLAAGTGSPLVSGQYSFGNNTNLHLQGTIEIV